MWPRRNQGSIVFGILMDSPSQSEFPPSTYATNNFGCAALFSRKLLFDLVCMSIGASPAIPIVVSVFQTRVQKTWRKPCKCCMNFSSLRGRVRRVWYRAKTCAVSALSFSSSAAETSLSCSCACKWGLALATCFSCFALADFQNTVTTIHNMSKQDMKRWIGWKTTKTFNITPQHSMSLC